MKIFGLTGGIAAGKSAVEAIITERFPVIDADRVSREVVAPGSVGLARVVAAFGEKVLSADGNLDRAAMRERIATDTEAKKKLEAILHPLIAETITSRLAGLGRQGHEAAFVSAALMLETGSYTRYEDGVIVVCAPEETRLARLLARDGMSEASARALMARQMPDHEKRGYATAVIENDGDLETLRRRTLTLLDELIDPER